MNELDQNLIKSLRGTPTGGALVEMLTRLCDKLADVRTMPESQIGSDHWKVVMVGRLSATQILQEELIKPLSLPVSGAAPDPHSYD